MGAPRPRELEELARIGITVIEMMPIAEFPGRFGWGYDGVDLYAPAHIYGTPDDLRAFVDRAHAARARRHPRRRLQPPRAGRQLPGRVLARLLHRQVHRTTGDGRSTSRGPRRRARYFVQNAALLDRGVPLRRPAPRRDAGHQGRVAAPRHRRDRRRRRAPRPAACRSYIVAENEPQDTMIVRDAGARRLRRGRALERRRASHRGGGADRTARGLLPRLPGHARRS